MNLQNKTSLEIVSLATVLIAVIGFIDYLFNLNFTSRLPYPWSLPVQFFRKFNHFVLFLLIEMVLFIAFTLSTLIQNILFILF
jgi:hypothetical protein